MHVQVITTRNRVDVLVFVFVASYFLCCGDVEMNPGPLDKDDLESKSDNELQDGTTSRTGAQPQASKTVST